VVIRQLLYYLVARGGPGLVNFFALAVFTRLLSTGDFGLYSLAISIVGLLNVILFYPLKMVLARYVPADLEHPELVMAPVLALFLALLAVLFSCGIAVSLMFDPAWQILGLLVVALTAAQAWHELNLSLASARIQPRRYGWLSLGKAVVALLLAIWLMLLGLEAEAPLLGLIIGCLVSWTFFSRKPWSGVKPKWPDPTTVSQYASYGVPFALTFALVWVTSSSDRVLIAWLLDDNAVGIYAAGYDLAQNSLGILLTILNTAALPLVFRAQEQQGHVAARAQLQHNGQLMFAVAFTGAAGLMAISAPLIGVMIGEDFRTGAHQVFPWIVASAAIVGIKSFHFDIAFQVAKRPIWLVTTSGIAAVINVIGNLVLIPHFGIVGAAWATLAALLGATVASAVLGQRIFSMPNVTPLLIKAITVAVPVYLVAHILVRTVPGAIAQLATSILVGLLLAAALAILLNLADLRQTLYSKFLHNPKK
jgi:O-antigen/teichoic acid export membrane protein